MPYKHSTDKLKIKREHDRRVKLTDEDKVAIVEEYATGLTSQRALAEKYNVSRRLIQFVLDPKKQERCKEQARKRQAEGRYYDREKHTEQTRKHRQYKQDLYVKNLLDVLE